MAILQAIFAFLSRSVGKVLTAVFGWAVVALFGQTTDKQKTFLSALVGAAVLWPLLVIGIVLPRAAAFLIAFVPAHAAIPDIVMRVIWLALALLIPVTMGLVVAAKAPPGTPAEPFAMRVLRGFPITVALAASFLITFATVPVLRVISIVRGREDVSIPAITDDTAYHQVARIIADLLRRHGIALERAEPPAHVTLPSKTLLKLGGKAFRGYIPQEQEYYRNGDLQVSFYPSGLLVRGSHRDTLRARALIEERLTHTPAVQTVNARAQDLEREIRRVWDVYDADPEAHASSKILLCRLDEITADARKLNLAHADWQVLYRQLLQLGRALQGQPQLIDKVDAQIEANRKMPEGLAAKAAWLARRVVETS
jgi:hypothetical protein